LPIRQTDRSSQAQLLLIEFIAKKNEPLLLRLKLNLSPQHINRGHNTLLLVVHRLVVDGFGTRHLSPCGVHPTADRDGV
jgi:hypothetical protein